MRILIAPGAFKECMSPAQAAEIINRAAHRLSGALGAPIETLTLPLSDGGSGLVDSVSGAPGAALHEAEVEGPLGEPVVARWCSFGATNDPLRTAGSVAWKIASTALMGWWSIFLDDDESQAAPISGRIGVIEMAQASGLALVPPDLRDPELTSTHGVGQLIRAALDDRCGRILLGVGDSATVDGGAGMLHALGVRFVDAQGEQIEPVCGGALGAIARIDLDDMDPRLAQCAVVVACDVRNPLLGPNGAARVFAPQKGATPEQVGRLEEGLANLVERCAQAGLQPRHETPGAGAAGGIAFALATFFDAELHRGVDLALESSGFHKAARVADLVLTGEGTLDHKSTQGKIVGAVARAAAAQGVPAVALVGRIEGDARALVGELGLAEAHEITPRTMPLDEALAQGPALLEAATDRALRSWLQREGRREL